MPIKNLVCTGVPGCLSDKHMMHHAAPPLEDIFNTCDVDSSGQLDKDQVFFCAEVIWPLPNAGGLGDKLALAGPAAAA